MAVNVIHWAQSLESVNMYNELKEYDEGESQGSHSGSRKRPGKVSLTIHLTSHRSNQKFRVLLRTEASDDAARMKVVVERR